MSAPLIAHVVHRFDFGGLENGLINLINLMPAASARHIVIALTEATEIQLRIKKADVRVYVLGKQSGKDFKSYVRLYRLLRQLKPDIVHTRNMGTLDCQFVAWLAGVKRRIHGEHGWDIFDPDGRLAKYRLIRKVLSPLIERFVALSEELELWLLRDVRISAAKVIRICNGVDTQRFFSRAHGPLQVGHCIVGSITRFSEIKDPLNAVRAFVELNRVRPGAARLLMVGDGPLKEQAEGMVVAAGLEPLVCFAGSVLDVAPYLAKMDIFVLGSRREGISNTVLEAMATGLPVVATNVGGNVELVDDGVTGSIVPPQSPHDLATAIATYIDDPEMARRHGAAGRKRVEDHFSMETMVTKYTQVYCVADRTDWN